jgi:hypothetical protein
MSSKITPGVIYELRENTDGYLKGSRWESIGGPDNDIFCDGLQSDYFAADELLRSSNQSILGYSEEMQYVKSNCLSGGSI